MNISEKIKYYYWASFRRKLLDKYQEKYKSIYRGIVLDIGGRDRGKFRKPKDKVEKWIFADISPAHKPDVVLDITKMDMIGNGSVDVVTAMEVFEYVENINDALRECFRVLKKDGKMIFSVPFLHPLADDPCDLQRWTKSMWQRQLTKSGFAIDSIEEMGYFFTVLAEWLNLGNKSCPRGKYFGYIFYPLLSLIAKLDSHSLVGKNKTLKSFTTGYFIIVKK
ncbi:MAG: class I SAM-dependent methyltransferase [Candidatus Pacebacteria bacterium]|nr:class I SAM-dependent methyltransferase [Candidatus Paceibacterota bacterium]